MLSTCESSMKEQQLNVSKMFWPLKIALNTCIRRFIDYEKIIGIEEWNFQQLKNTEGPAFSGWPF